LKKIDIPSGRCYHFKMDKQILNRGFFVLLLLIAISMGAKAEAYVRPKPNEIILNCDRYKHDDLISLACNMYWEANTQGDEGMLAVAAVTLQRVNHPKYPHTIRDVVWENRFIKKKFRAQFSWTLDGQPDIVTVYGKKTWKRALQLARLFAVSAEHEATMCPKNPATIKMWDYLDSIRTVKVKRHPVYCEAYLTLMKSKAYIADTMDPTGGALYYHADYVDPWWSNHFVKTVQIVNHIFYRPHTRKVAYTRK
jgi:hypothetical protein